jgi:hypothetical protein
MAVNFPNSPANGATVSVGNKTLEYNSTTGTWQIQASNIGAFAVSDTAPSSPANGDLWFNSASLNLYAYYADGDSSQWLQVGTDAEEAQQLSATSSDTAPTSPNAGDMWFDTSELNLYIYYNDGNTSQWVQMNSENTDGISDVSDLTDTTNLLFDGQYSSLTGAPTSSTAGALGTLTKTFTQNEEAEITLSETISPVPNVSVFKEVPQGGLTSKGNWDVNANATNYEFFDEKPISYTSTTLTPSATGDGTFTSSNPTVVGYDISGISSVGDYETATPVSQVPSPPPNGYTLADFVISPDGTKIIIVSAQRMHEFTMSTAYDITSASWTQRYDYDAYNPSTWGGYGFLELGDSGSKLYMADWQNNKIDQFTLSVPYSLGNGGSDVSFSGEVTGMNNSGSNQTQNGMYVKDSTTVFIMKDDVTGNQAIIEEWVMSTAWDITTLSYNNKTKSITGQRGTDMTFSSDGLTMFITDVFGSGTLKYFSLGTAWDISTINTTGTTFTNPALTNSTPQSINFSKSGTKLYMADGTKIYEQDTGYSEVFSSTDVGKVVTGNSGSAIISAISGTYKSVTAFADTSTISSWTLTSSQGKADGSGIELTGYETSFDWLGHDKTTPSSSRNGSFPGWGQSNTVGDYQRHCLSPNGDYYYMFTQGSQLTNIVYKWELTTPYDLSTMSYIANYPWVYFNNTKQMMFSPDGNQFIRNNTTYHTLCWQTAVNGNYSGADRSNAAYQSTGSRTFHYGALISDKQANAQWWFWINEAGTKLFIGESWYDKMYSWDISTAWDLSTVDTSSQVNYAANSQIGDRMFAFSNDGTQFLTNRKLYQNFPTPYNSTSALTVTPTTTNIYDGTLNYISLDQQTYLTGDDSSNVSIYRDLGSTAKSWPIYSPVLTGSTGQINSSSWVDLDSMVADETKNDGDVFYAVSTDDRTSWGVIKNGDGVRKIARNNSGTWQYNNDAGTSVNMSYDIANAVDESVSYTPSNPTFSSVMAYTFNSDGTKLYSAVTGVPWQHELSTAFDISTASSIGYNYSADIQETNARFITFNPAGTKMYLGGVVNNTIYQYSLSSGFDLAGASVSRDTSKTFTITNNSPGTASVSLNGMIFNNDGTKMYITNQERIEQYSLSTAYDISTASYDSINVVVATGDFPTDTKFNSDGTKLFIIGTVTDSVHQYSLSTAYDLSTISYDSISFSVSGTISNPRSLNFNNDGSKMYISNLTGGVIYQYTTSGTQIVYDTSETWVDGTNNNEHATLQEALGAQSFNRMDKAQLQAVTDPNHYVLGDTLDLMIAPYAASGTSPLSDGVTIGYQADALIKQAINGTDYEAEFPTTNKVKIKSLAAQNLKIRII